MKKTLLSFCFLGLSILTYAQFGVGVSTPKTTLHIVGRPTDTNTTDGIIAPIITRTDLIAKNNQYAADQTGAFVYVSDVTGTADTTKAINVNTVGYYYFDGTKWMKLSGTVTASNGLTKDTTTGDVQFGGTLIKPTTINQGANTLAFTNTPTNGFSVDGTTLSVDPINDEIGIGTTTPDTNSKLEISNSNKGLLLPRVALTATQNPSPLTAHVEGMEVYNTTKAITVVGQEVYPGKYINDGTQWIREMNSTDKQLIAGGTGQDLISPTTQTISNSQLTTDLISSIPFTLTKPSLVDFSATISAYYENGTGGPITDGSIKMARTFWLFSQKPTTATNINTSLAYGTSQNQFTSNGTYTVTQGQYMSTPSFTVFLPEGSYRVRLVANTPTAGVQYKITWGQDAKDSYSIVSTAIK
jgi:hypothetical protein